MNTIPRSSPAMRHRASVATGLLTSLLLSLCPAAPGAEFFVNSTADLPDNSPGDGVATTGGTVGGQPECTLRAAIMEADAAPAPSSSPHIIHIPAGTYLLTHSTTDPAQEEILHNSGSISLVQAAQSNDLDLGVNVHLIGDGPHQTIIDGNGSDRVLQIHGNALVRDLTLRNGSVSNPRIGGGVHVRAGTEVRFENVHIEHNRALQSSGGGVAISGFSGVWIVFERCEVTHNEAAMGGGFDLQGGSYRVVLDEVWVDSNNATQGLGGGVYNRMRSQELIQGTIPLSMPVIGNSTISRNFSLAGGGGLANEGDMEILNSTISENTAGGSGGGGIYNRVRDSGEPATFVRVRYCTIAFNATPPTAGTPAASGGGLHLAAGMPLTMGHSILALNARGGTPSTDILGGSPSNLVGAPISSLGHNLAWPDAAGLNSSGDPSDITAQDPLLFRRFANYGGHTPTHPLDAGSPAIDAGIADPSGIPDVRSAGPDNRAADGRFRDQRGVARPFGAASDIGAYERTGPPLFQFIRRIPVRLPWTIEYVDAISIPLHLFGSSTAAILEVEPGDLGGTIYLKSDKSGRKVEAILTGISQKKLDRANWRLRLTGQKPILVNVRVQQPKQGVAFLEVRDAQVEGAKFFNQGAVLIRPELENNKPPGKPPRPLPKPKQK